MVAMVGGDGQGRAVAEGLVPGGALEVPARGDFHRGGAALAAVGAGADLDVGGVHVDVSGPAAQVPALLGHTDGGQDQTVGQGLEAGCGCPPLGSVPDRGVEVGVPLGQAGAAVVADGIQGGGDGVQAPVEAFAGGVSRSGTGGRPVRDVQPAAGSGSEAVVQDAPGVGDGGAAGVVRGQQQPGQYDPGDVRLWGRAGP